VKLSMILPMVVAASVSPLLVAACGGGLATVDQTDLQNAATLNLKAYQMEDAASTPAALERAAYCATIAVLRDQKIAITDAGVPCGP
jgi:hypothetical protein